MAPVMRSCVRVLVVLSLAPMSGSAVTRDPVDGCCTPPQWRSVPETLKWQITSNPGSVSLSGLQSALAAATDKWESKFQQQNKTVSISQGGGDIKIVIRPDWDLQTSGGATYYKPTHPTNPNELHIAQDALTRTDVPAEYLPALVLHELGHPLGFDQATCADGSVMANTNTDDFRQNFTSCDTVMMTTYYPRRDDDTDGWSPDDDFPDQDCDDSNANINPGIIPWCDVSIDDDNNCDGVPDYTQCESPILIDVIGNGFRLTNRSDGVAFDLNGDGIAEPLAWTAIGSDDAWLALDRNGNGAIDNGGELFGNWTPQPPSLSPNGFIALAVFDHPANGGNQNEWFDVGDSAFGLVRLWRDANHDGVSQASELQPLNSVGIERIGLEYREVPRIDQWGNAFRYRARVIDLRTPRDAGQWAYDVFLGAGRPSPNLKARVRGGR